MTVQPLPRRMIIPRWSATVGQMAATAGVRVQGVCSRCKRHWPLDPAFLAREKGPFWTLWGRNLRCSRCGGEAIIQASNALGTPVRPPTPQGAPGRSAATGAVWVVRWAEGVTLSVLCPYESVSGTTLLRLHKLRKFHKYLTFPTTVRYRDLVDDPRPACNLEFASQSSLLTVWL